MVQFAKKLKSQQLKGWEEHYLNYKLLKKKIKKEKKKSESSDDSKVALLEEGANGFFSKESVAHSVSSGSDNSPNLVIGHFVCFLNSEIDKVVLFFLQRQGIIAEKLSALQNKDFDCRQSKVGDNVNQSRRFSQKDLTHYAAAGSVAVIERTSSFLTQHGFSVPEDGGHMLKKEGVAELLEYVEKQLDSYREVGKEIFLLLRFVDLNITGIRKILKKYDKNFKSNLSKQYLGTVMEYSAFTGAAVSPLSQLYHHEGIIGLVSIVRSSMHALHQIENQCLGPLASTKISSRGSGSAHIDPSDSFRLELRNALLTSVADDDNDSIYEPILIKIDLARQRLHQSTNFVQTLATGLMLGNDFMSEISEDNYDELVEIEKRRRKAKVSRASSFLNLASTFLYLANYYIVAPTGAELALRLGSDPSMIGVIIGLTPFANLFSATLYSWWANKSYKPALVFAAVTSIIGNLFYALSLQYHSIYFVMLGRFLGGFGGARAINRRFIADSFPNDQRTAASAAFVTASALGTSAGPFMAAVFALIPKDTTSLLWTQETAPGWFMFLVWFVYLVALIYYFEEPVRVYEIKKSIRDDQETEITETIQQNGGEATPLLSANSCDTEEDSSKSPKESASPPPLYKNTPVMLTLWLYFMLKFVLECLISSCPEITHYYFGWEATLSGIYMAILGFLIFPANVALAIASQKYEDRKLLHSFNFMIIIGMVGICSYGLTQYYTIFQYVLFGILLFMGTNLLEGVCMSLLSKTIPRAYAMGVFNSGYLATQSGTFGRAVGDVWFTFATLAYGLDHALDFTFLPMLLVVIASFLLAIHWNKYLTEKEDDDDDDD